MKGMRDKEIDGHIGGVLKTARIEAGMTQTELADAMGITFQQVQKYERGFNSMAPVRLLSACKVLGMKPADFYPKVTEKSEPELGSRFLTLANRLKEIESEPMRSIAIEACIGVAGGMNTEINRLRRLAKTGR